MSKRPLHHELFLELLRSALWDKVPDYNSFRNLDESIWQMVMATAQKQALLGVCYPALNRLPSDCRPSPNVYLVWAAKANYIRQDNKKKLKVLSELLSLFENHDIHPVVMKGFSSAILYPEPDLRICGDIDLYIPDKYKEAVKFIEILGFEISFTHKHHKFYYDGVLIELHHDIISPPFRKLREYSIHEVEYPGVKFKVFDETTTGILLLTHAVTHLIGPGLGFRHLCDYALFSYKYSFIEPEQFYNYITDNRLWQIINIFNELIETIRSNNSPCSRKINFIEKDIFSQGDCGKNELTLRNTKINFIVYCRILVRILKFIMYDKLIPFNILRYRLRNKCNDMIRINEGIFFK